MKDARLRFYIYKRCPGFRCLLFLRKAEHKEGPAVTKKKTLALSWQTVKGWDADVSLSLISTEEKERYKLWEPTSAVGMSLYRFKTSTPGVKDRKMNLWLNLLFFITKRHPLHLQSLFHQCGWLLFLPSWSALIIDEKRECTRGSGDRLFSSLVMAFRPLERPWGTGP